MHRVLFLTHRLPYAPNRGDRIRSFQLLKRIRGKFKVDLISLIHDDEEASHVDDDALTDLVESVTPVRVPRIRNLLRGAVSLPGRRPLTHSLLNAPAMTRTIEEVYDRNRPDLVVSLCSSIHACHAPKLHSPHHH